MAKKVSKVSGKPTVEMGTDEPAETKAARFASIWKAKDEEFTQDEDFAQIREALGTTDEAISYTINDETRDGTEGHTLKGTLI